ncbi:MAG: DUF1553 domain-containing protein [Planctomycetaceae bacterium]|nr:MAG: DUF1553 domain-containing protein [Planctomycetaceae bacterium]
MGCDMITAAWRTDDLSRFVPLPRFGLLGGHAGRRLRGIAFKTFATRRYVMVTCLNRGGSVRLVSAALLVVALFSLVAAFAGTATSAEAAGEVEFFEKRIRPLLVEKCLDCHGADDAAAKLRLDSRAGWQRGGERGPAIVPGDPAASLLIRVVSHRDPALRMPPDEAGGKLTDAEIDDLMVWIRQGAADPRTGERVVTDIEAAALDHWAFRPLAPPLIEAAEPDSADPSESAGTDSPDSESSDGNLSHPIDRLIARGLDRNGFVTTEPADMPTLIRRTLFDLHGLPPTAEDLATSRDDYLKLVRRLLDSPRYGERWGRHWLDVARYSDAKDGVLMYGDARIRPFAYTYRDYVIRSFNEDKPLDQFIREQLAADQLGLAGDAPELAALGLLTLGRMFDNNRHDVIDDQIDVISRGLLGLTVSCARCHDHKFDPIPTADYYSLYGVLASGREPYDRPRIEPVSDAGRAYEDEFAAKLREVRGQQQTHYAETLRTARERTADYLVQVATTEPDNGETTIFFLSLIPDQLRPQITHRWRQAIARRAFPDDPVFAPWYDLMRGNPANPAAWEKAGVDRRIIDGLIAANPQSPAEVATAYGEILRSAWQAWEAEQLAAMSAASEGEESEGGTKEALAERPEITVGRSVADPLAALLVSRDSPLWFPIEEVASYLSRQPGDAFRGLLGELDAIGVKHPDAAARAMVIVDSEVLCDPVIFQRGDPAMRGAPVPRRFLEILSSSDRSNFAQGAGRLELADAIAAPDNPLTARVWVNRVWMHHFGEPLVENPGDFGLQTPAPEQLELLDFLADYLIRHDWRTKPLHELILTSQAYQRSSTVPSGDGANDRLAQQAIADPDNRWLWRANRRRLDFEAMRDSLLWVAGELDETLFGRPRVLTDPENRRRTIYGFVERQSIPAMVQTFDVANADTSTSRRVTTTVPQQALFAMNSRFMLDRAAALAKRVETQIGDVPGDQPGVETGDGSTSADTSTSAANDPIDSLYEIVFGRVPAAEERAAASEFLDSATLTQLAQVLLMSNEWMFVD